MADAVIRSKQQRIRRGGRPRLLDLFSGCGGLSLGFERAGCDVVAAVEFDPLAALSHARNFHRSCSPEKFKHHALARDITKTEPSALVYELGLAEKMEAAIDIVVGGPPCQAFARVGRAKLREIAEHPEAFLKDPRGNLYTNYLHYIKQLRPGALLMENVPDALNYGGENVAEEVATVLEEMGYQTAYALLNAVHYGVPQMRERMFLIGVHNDAGSLPGFPKPTHKHDLPAGYEGSRQVALKALGLAARSERPLIGGGDSKSRHYVEAPRPEGRLPSAVTAAEALGDLPRITGHLDGTIRRGARRFTELQTYAKEVRPGSYSHQMRNWPGFESREGVRDHVIRYLPRDYAIFREMMPGDQYPEAQALAVRLFEKEVERRRKAGEELAVTSRAYRELRREMVPPYDPSKFPNKWRKLEPDKPTRTLMAHLGKDSYSHIHYESDQARTISVREAARLQSFPDGFIFEGTMNPAFRQIGNAVPPLLAYAVAKEMVNALRGVEVPRQPARRQSA